MRTSLFVYIIMEIAHAHVHLLSSFCQYLGKEHNALNSKTGSEGINRY